MTHGRLCEAALSTPEQVLYHRLVTTLPGHIVLAQVQALFAVEIPAVSLSYRELTKGEAMTPGSGSTQSPSNSTTTLCAVL